MMKRNLICVTIFLLLINIFSLLNANAQDKRNFPNVQGKVNGKVFDKELNSPLESVTIQLFRMKDSSLVTGAITNSKGEFSLDTKGGKFKLVASYVGYNTVVVNGIMITPENKEITIETIKLESGSTTISQIDVTAERSYFEAGIDKKIYNIEKDLMSQNGTALDALKNIPSVTVDIDGNVSMRGSGNLKVLVNGRPSNYAGDIASLLEQIPANTIQSIEIITNPSSKYDPEGTAGIINIVLKQEQESGYFGSINSGTGTGDKYNISTNLGIRKGLFNFTGNYGLRSFRMGGFGNSLRENFINDTTSFLSQSSTSSNKMLSHIGGLGVEFDMTKKITLGLSGNYNWRTRDRNEISNSSNLDFNQSPTYVYDRNNNDNETGNGYELTFNYRMKFDKPKEELTGTASYSYRGEDENLAINQYNRLPYSPDYLENDYSVDKDYHGLLQFDYVNPFNENSKLEFGYKGTYTKMNSDFRADIFDNIQQIWINNPFVTDNFVYKSMIHAFYGTYGAKFGSFSFQAGLRAEQSFTTADQITQNKTFENNYFSLFPSIYLTQTITKNQDIQLSYSRRINRPRSFFLNPFVDYSDPQNLRAGNPELNPEYINSFELGYLKYFNSFSLTSSIFYKLTNDVINRITTLSDSNVTMTTFKNLSKASSYGLEFIASGQLLNWWFLNGNFSYYRTIVQGDYGAGELDNSNYTWSARLNTTLSFPNLFDMQIAYNYNGKMVSAQGTTDPFQSFDIALKRDFFNRKLTVGFRISDLFNSFKFNSTSVGTGFDMTSTRKRDSRIAFLTLTYKFGKEAKSQDRKKPKKDENDNNGNMDDY
jgi:outer membrane receptor protein involved in Fe transport